MAKSSSFITAMHNDIVQINLDPTTPLGAIAYDATISPRACRFAGLFINLIAGPQTLSGVVTCEIVSIRGAGYNRLINPTVAGATVDLIGTSNFVWLLDGNSGSSLAGSPVPMEKDDQLKVDWSNPDGLDYGWGIFHVPGNEQATYTTT